VSEILRRIDDLLAQRDRLREALKEILFEVARVEFLENKKIIYDVLRAEARAALEASKP